MQESRHARQDTRFACLADGWPGIVSGISDQANTREKENGAENSVNDQALNLPFGALCIHEHNCAVYKADYPENCEYDSENAFEVHRLLSDVVAKKLPATAGNQVEIFRHCFKQHHTSVRIPACAFSATGRMIAGKSLFIVVLA